MTATFFRQLGQWPQAEFAMTRVLQSAPLLIVIGTILLMNSSWVSIGCAQEVNNGNSKTAAQEEKHDDLRALQLLNGKWDTTIRIWTGKSGDPAIETKGSAEFKSTLNGKFIHESSAGEIGKEKYTGVGYWGFDENKKKFTRVWVDSMNSATVHCEGSIDHSRNMVTLYGKVSGFGDDKHEKMMRWELDFSDPKKVVLKMFDLTIHKDAKVFEIEYEKKEQDSK